MFHDRIQSVNFAPHTAEEIRTLAVKQITSTETYDVLLHPLPDGLYDTAFGPNDRDERCDTCGLGPMNCPGHFGYIELPLPVYHPMFYKLMLNILTGSCFTCHRLITKLSKTHLFVKQSELLDKGYLTAANDLKDLYKAVSSRNSSSSATEMDLQMTICHKIDESVNELINDTTEEKKSKFTKNLIKTRLDLVNNFIKNDLKMKVKTCPHCRNVKRSIRQEYNTRVYFKAVNPVTLKRIVGDRKKSQNLATHHGVSNAQPRPEREENGGTDDVLENEEEEEDDDEEGEEREKDDQAAEEEEVDEVNDFKKNSTDEYITPEEIKNHLIQLWNTDGKAMKCLLGAYNGPERSDKVTTPEIFFLDVISVPPSRFRPQSFMGEKRFENPQTSNLNKILWSCKLVKEILFKMHENGENNFTPVVLINQGIQMQRDVSVPGKTYKEQLNNAWNQMQANVNSYMDCELNKLSLTKVPGVRQLLEKKEGLFRKHMMGKRVNYACRSVISPDLFINTDEIGVPLVFARKLTYPQPVTPWNLNQLKEMVINGPNKYPGAVMVELEDGKKQILTDDENERRGLAKKLLSSNIHSTFSNNDRVISEKKVYRHLINGDVMLLNRQPTLHRPSIMAHKVKVLPKQRTLRLHYANCKSYNADFDGDEMNAHFPQNELGRSEAYNLVSTNYNYLSPKDGKPLAGLIQDHVVSGVRMTSRDAMFKREEYQQLVFNGLIDKQGRIKLLPPCILKPIPLWSGKQVFSTVLLNIIPKGKYPLNMAGNKAKVFDANWPKDKEKKSKGGRVYEITDPFLLESQVIIREGELMTGILDKTQYGAAAFSLIHCVYEIYGGEISGKLLSVLARLFTAYLQHTGFTLGVEAILVLPNAEKKRRELLNEGRQCGDASAKEAVNLDGECDQETLYERLREAHYTNQGAELRQLDLAMKSRTDAINNKVNSVCMRGLLQKFPHNSLQLMVQSGAKGSSVNTMQISCLLGQIELEGRRPPLSMSGRSLPSFVPYDTSPRAGGFVDGRFLTGIRPQEYFFHCMAGREGLIDTAVKTSRSGYLQRCLIKHLEALYVQYDMTVRDGDGSVVQFLYGDDSIDVLKCQFLQKNQFKTVVDNNKSYVSILKPHEMSKVVDVKKAKKLQRKQDKWKKQHGELFSSRYAHDKASPFTLYEKDCRRKVEKKYPSKDKQYHRTQADLKLMERWNKSDGPTKESYISQCQPAPDPTLSTFNPACHFGAVSEKFRLDVLDYIRQNPDDLLSSAGDEDDKKSHYKNGLVNEDTFEPMMLIKYMRSLVEPGEAVGLLAGQSIGEPSTQMTLNTFHFAGRGEMNVTLGIPRLREILMTASKNIKTPQMDVLVKPGQEETAKSISRKLTKVTLMQVLKHVSVQESIEMSDQNLRVREYKIRIELLPSYTFEDITEVTDADIMIYIETIFLNKISRSVYRIMQHALGKSLVKTSKVRASSSNRQDEDEEVDEPVPDQAPPDEPDDRADLSDEDAENDGDADDMKGRNRRTQFTSYDDPDNREEEMNEDFDEDSRDSINDSATNIKSEMVDEEYSMEKDEAKPTSRTVDDKKPLRATLIAEDPRVSRTLRSCSNLKSYLYNPDNEWCEATMQFPLLGSKMMLVGLIEKLAEKAVVHEAPGIQRAMVSECKDPKEAGRSRLKCEGVSLQQLWKYPDVLDLDSLYSNNIHRIAESYGIEAGRRALIKEVEDVFKVYGIQINPRHLSLIADYMTYEGVYKPFNRVGIESNPFPFQKMSFETSTHFLKAATAFGQPDDLGSPSSRIIVGRVIGQGTGIVDLLPKLSA